MSTFERVRAIIADLLDIGESDIEPQSSLRNDLNADSLEIADLIIQLEDEFHCEIPNDDIEHIFTVADIVRYADSHRN